ncbi:MAG: tRNA (adenosine(37)-N6)-threonylcarbamoyltransferase complex dimerization subunit type 1 TsaB [Alphaproteobacteria bacterium]|nr:tRNA (adenosine(37)-N6)-threonylcarbamoyltransferase complex dimerization subunit type 1 TsaB [Alphaproteobacteria bacterium]
MKNKLAITASLKQCSIATRYNDTIYQINEEIDSASCLVEVLKQMFDQYHLDIHNIDELITISGPGSFTGIRTAQSCIKGLEFSLNIQATCVSYFEVIRHLCECKENLVAIIRSEKNELYFCDFESQQMGISSVEKLLSILSQNSTLAGEIPEEFQYLYKTVSISNFRYAVHLLDINSRSKIIKPLYINARSNT